jgi:hypothetical protein
LGEAPLSEFQTPHKLTGHAECLATSVYNPKEVILGMGERNTFSWGILIVSGINREEFQNNIRLIWSACPDICECPATIYWKISMVVRWKSQVIVPTAILILFPEGFGVMDPIVKMKGKQPEESPGGR